MVCADEEAAQIGNELSQFDSGCLVTYRRVEDLVLNAPAGKVALVVLAGQDDPAAMRRTLHWLRRRWPDCPLAVVGEGQQELDARKGGALFLAQLQAGRELPELVRHVMARHEPASLKS